MFFFLILNIYYLEYIAEFLFILSIIIYCCVLSVVCYLKDKEPDIWLMSDRERDFHDNVFFSRNRISDVFRIVKCFDPFHCLMF